VPLEEIGAKEQVTKPASLGQTGQAFAEEGSKMKENHWSEN
jgi:hypothetical protein